MLVEIEVCSCRASGPRYPEAREFRRLGFADSERFGTIDVRIYECLACGSLWLKCHHESDERPGAGATRRAIDRMMPTAFRLATIIKAMAVSSP